MPLEGFTQGTNVPTATTTPDRSHNRAEKMGKVCAALEEGLSRRAACRAAGISHTTFYEWIKAPDVLDSVTRAEDAAQEKMERIIIAAAPKDWRAAQVYLERRRPEEWGRRQRLDHTSAPITVTLTSKDQRQMDLEAEREAERELEAWEASQEE